MVEGDKKIRFIDRTKETEDPDTTISNISNQSEYRSLKPFPNYNFYEFPYVLIKDSKSLNVINVRTMQSRVILRDSPYFQDIPLTSLMDF